MSSNCYYCGGDPDEVIDLRHRRDEQDHEIDRLRKQLVSAETRLAEIRKTTIEHCALIAEGFDAACDSERMKLFVEAGLVIAVYKRDGEIGAAIREFALTDDLHRDETPDTSGIR